MKKICPTLAKKACQRSVKARAVGPAAGRESAAGPASSCQTRWNPGAAMVIALAVRQKGRVKVGSSQVASIRAAAPVRTVTTALPARASSAVDGWAAPRKTAQPTATRQALNPSRPAVIRSRSTPRKRAVAVPTAVPVSP